MKRSFAFLGAALLCSLAVVSDVHAQQAWNSITLSWTTPGDDSLSGSASQFDIRYSTSPITAANFGSATRWTIGVPAPAVPGTRQSTLVTGLVPATTYYFAIKTGDDVPNWASISNVATKTTTSAPDTTRPAALAISINGLTDTTATVQWTATGDDSLAGTATSYDVRYSTSPITAANWASASQATGEPAPGAPGTVQSTVVRGLARQTTYYFAARSSDEVGNTSALSNVPQATTLDTKPPATISDLSAGLLLAGFSTAFTVPSRAVLPPGSV